jgi:hypothetical protein
MQPDQLAAKLSKAQREAVLWLGIDRDDFERFPAGMEEAALSMVGMKEVRLILRIYHGDCDEYRLTPLGQSVRSALMVGRE